MKKLLTIVWLIISLISFAQIGRQDKASFFFLDTNIGWFYYEGKIFKTSDAGDTWVMQSHTETCSRFYFISDSIGFDERGTKLYKTNDQGVSWQLISNIKGFYDYHFFDELNGYGLIYKLDEYFSGLYTHLYKTSDGGYNWEFVSVINKEHCKMWIQDSLNIYLAPWRLNPIISTDGGITWSEQSINLPEFPYYSDFAGINKICYADSNNGFIVFVGDLLFDLHGGLFITNNRGTTWRYDTTIVDDVFNIFFTDSNNGFIIGYDHDLQLVSLKTTNKGLTWVTHQFSGSAITFIDSMNGFTINMFMKQFCKSTDGGATWICNNNITIIDTTTTSIRENNFKFTYSLAQNYPNPFNPSTRIKYSIPEQELVIIKVYDVLGNEVAQLVNEIKNAGEHEVELDASQLNSGVYFYKIYSGEYSEVKKMILMK